jgi:hypothetical protein
MTCRDNGHILFDHENRDGHNQTQKTKYDPFSNLKDVSQKPIHKIMGPVKMAYFIFLIFFNETWHVLDGHEKIMT